MDLDNLFSQILISKCMDQLAQTLQIIVITALKFLWLIHQLTWNSFNKDYKKVLTLVLWQLLIYKAMIIYYNMTMKEIWRIINKISKDKIKSWFHIVNSFHQQIVHKIFKILFTFLKIQVPSKSPKRKEVI